MGQHVPILLLGSRHSSPYLICEALFVHLHVLAAFYLAAGFCLIGGFVASDVLLLARAARAAAAQTHIQCLILFVPFTISFADLK